MSARTGLRAATLLAAAIAAAPVHAATFSEADVRVAVETWVRNVTLDARPDATVERMEPFTVAGETVAWIAHLRDAGFCLAGADAVVLPVYLFVPKGTYTPDQPGLRAVLEEIAERTRLGRQALADESSVEMTQALDERAAEWSGLVAGRGPLRKSTPEGILATPAVLRLPTQALWDQPDPYNALLPDLTPGANEHVLTGCNATATAQIMCWWQWPYSGVGAGSVPYNYRFRTNWDSEPCSFNPGSTGLTNRLRWVSGTLQMNGYWDNSVYGAAQNVSSNSTYRTALANLWSRMTLVNTAPTANFANSTYDWNQMPASATAPYGPEDVELALLMRDVSIGCESDLGVFSTNSYFGNDVAALVDHFRYNSDALFTPSGGTIQMLTDEIQWGRLAGLGGSNAAGAGHAWVIEGYDTTTDPNRLFWMNFGWSGSSNAWYTFDTAPFPLAHDMMTRLAPLNVHFVGAFLAGDGSPSRPYRDMTEALAEAPNNVTLHLRAGSDNAWTGTINRPLLIKGYGAVVH